MTLIVTVNEMVATLAILSIQPLDHYIGGFDERCHPFALLQVQLSGGIGCDDCHHLVLAHGYDYLCHQALDAHAYDFARELISAAHAPVSCARIGIRSSAIGLKKWPKIGLAQPVMASGRQGGLDLAFQNPFLDGGVADSEHA
jgi:hypothetical protein